MFSRVLVPVDGSPDAGVALHHAIAIAREAGALIHALYVADSKLIESAYRIASSPKTSAFESNPGLSGIAVAARARLADYGQRTLADAHAHCVAASIPCETEYVEGVVVNVILNRAAHMDLIVMGRRGEGANWAGPQLGSVFEAVVRHARIPVLAVQAEIRPVRRILVAFDGSECANAALKIAMRMARHRGRSLIVLTVDDGLPGRHAAWQSGRARLAQQARPGAHCFVSGQVSGEILRLATAESCDLIALGAYGDRRFVATSFGSTVDEVLHESIHPVLVCR
jgi:nucleotide-binding universal stress UspA family protein